MKSFVTRLSLALALAFCFSPMTMAATPSQQESYKIPKKIKKKYPELVQLILHTESMDDAERQYWLDLLPSMKPEQIQKLYDILKTEQQKLQALEEKYVADIKALNEKYSQKQGYYKIPREVQRQYPELVPLILNTEAMDDAERQYWFDHLPSMKPEQVQQLYDVLNTEQQKLKALEEKYLQK